MKMVDDEKEENKYHALSLKNTVPDNDSIRKAICFSDVMIGAIFIKLTISEDRTGQNGSEAKARLCALIDESGISTGSHLRFVSQSVRRGQ